MTISSRTPEGDPNHCPVCGRNTHIEPSTVPTRDAPCPHCGALLSFDLQGARALGLAKEIAELSLMALSSKEYHNELLRRLIRALDAVAGSVWLLTPHGNLQQRSGINLPQVDREWDDVARNLHDHLLRQVFDGVQVGLLEPHWGIETSTGHWAGNPTDYDLLLVPITRKDDIAGIIEVWQDPTRPCEAKQADYQFLIQTAGFASLYASQTSSVS